jgi:DNA-binding SARP family transcriptional activator/tetratricopeptide (TPR) repeat protein
MRLCGLGPLAILAASGESSVPANRDRALLAVLMLNANQVVEQGFLVDAVWGDQPPTTARAQLHTCVSRVRRLLPPDVLQTAPGGYLLSVGPRELDLLEFESLVAQARRDVAAGRTADGVEVFRAALDLWRGAAFTGVDSQVVRSGAASLEELRSRVWEECLDAELSLGRAAELVGELTARVHEYPTRERLRGQLMLALYRTGRRADALAVFRETRELLADELGVEPGPDLVELHRQMLRGDERLATGTRDREPPRCLPRDVADFVGREDALGRLLGAIPEAGGAAGRASVVLAVDGMPGVGKTAVAVRVAHLVADRYPDGALYLDLHGHSEHAPLDPAAALNVLLHQLDVPGERIPESLDGRIARWRSELADRRVLLLLDNAASSAQVAPLLPGSDGCLTLVTSRQRLVDLDGVRPVSLEVLTAGEAVALLHRIVGERVAGDEAGAAAVARVCGYLALAIRLAAARLAHRPTWTVRDLLARLESARPVLAELATDGRSLDTAFALSHQSLPEPERRMFRMLGLHPGEEFDARAAAAMADLELHEAAAIVDRLVDAHLLAEPSAGRYRLHDLLRDYARGLAGAQQTAEDRRAAVERLLDWYLHAAVIATAPLELSPFDFGLTTPPRYPLGPLDPAGAVDWFAIERANLVAGVRVAEELGLAGTAWRLARATCRFLFLRGYNDDLIEANTVALRAAQGAGDRLGEATARSFRAAGYSRRGRFLEAYEDLKIVLGYRQDSGDREGEATTRYLLASQAAYLSWPATAMEHVNTSLRLNRELGLTVGEGMCRAALGEIYRVLGRLDEAMEQNLAALACAREAGSGNLIALAEGHIGAVELALGHLDEAEVALRQSLAKKHALGNLIGEAEALLGLAELYRRRGDVAAALRYDRDALDVTCGGADLLGECAARNSFGTSLRLAGVADAARDQHRQALALAVEIRNRFEEARALAGLAELTAGTDRAGAVGLWRDALKIFQELGVPERHAVAARLDQDG